MSRLVSVAQAGEVKAGDSKRVMVDDHPIAIFNIGGEYFAVEDNCSHEDTPLSDGYVDEETCTVECALHGSRFDLRTGKALSFPAIFPVKTFEAVVEGGELKVRVN